MIVEPSEEDLIWGQTEEIFDGFTLLAQTVELGVKLNIDLGEQSSTNDLPDETKDQMFTTLRDISRTDVDDGATYTLCRGDDDVVVLGNLEGVQWFTSGGFVENTRVDGVWNGVVDEFTEDQPVLDLVEDLHGICRNGVSACEVGVIFDNLVDVSHQ